MKRFNKTAACFFVLAAFIVGCASNRDYAPNTQTKATKVETHDYGQSAVIRFSPGSADLNDATKAKLRETVATIGLSNISRVEVASWSDKAFPKEGPDLPAVDRQLAEKRAEQIGDFLRQDSDISLLRIRNYSMAETSNWLARMLKTDEAEIKSVFSKQGETPIARGDFNVILNEGGPSKAVVIFIRK